MSVVDHEAEALACLKPPLRVHTTAYSRLVRAIVRPFATFEEALDEIARCYSLSTSKTPLWMLRAIAARFGLDLVPGFSKDEYRVFIRAQAAAILSSGTWPQVYHVANLLRPLDTPAESLAWVDRVPPDGLQIAIPGIPAHWAPVAKQILRQAVRGQDQFDLLQLPSDFFTYDIGPGFDIGKLAKIL